MIKEMGQAAYETASKYSRKRFEKHFINLMVSLPKRNSKA